MMMSYSRESFTGCHTFILRKKRCFLQGDVVDNVRNMLNWRKICNTVKFVFSYSPVPQHIVTLKYGVLLHGVLGYTHSGHSAKADIYNYVRVSLSWL